MFFFNKLPEDISESTLELLINNNNLKVKNQNFILSLYTFI